MAFTLTETEEREIRIEQKQAKRSKDVVEHIKLSVLLFLNAKATITLIADGLGIDIVTVSKYAKKYKEAKSLSQYLKTHYDQIKHRKTLTNKEIEILKQELDKGYYTTSKSIGAFIKKKFGKDFTPNGLCQSLKRWGYIHKQVKVTPGKADSQKQKEFVKKMEEIKDNLTKNNEKMYFLDGVHLTHNTRSVKIWCKKGKEKIIKSNTGRKRININGAMNATNPCEVVYRNDKSVNAQSTIKLFKDILAKNRHSPKIHLICDNARYYKNKDVTAFIKDNPKLQIHHPPPYSPNLNLIERLWRLLRKEKLDLNYYEKYDDFTKGVLEFFDDLKNYENQLKPLMTFKFHIPNT